MLLFLDTEYTDFIDCELISIGMVSEDGQHELYLEVTDFDRAKCNAHVRSNIWPLLGQPLYRAGRSWPPETIAKAAIAHRLQSWFAGLPRSVTVACDSETDWALLLDAIEDCPANLTGRYDLRTLIDMGVFHRAVLEYHAVPNRPWHHALHDACAHRAGWMAYMDATKQRRILQKPDL